MVVDGIMWLWNGYVDGPEASASCPNYCSGRTSPNTESEATQSLVSMSHDFTTGCNTERSSLCSFDDGFDQQGSRRVHAFFKEIDSMLFEDSQGAKHLQGECKDWTTSFPHLRILGRQVGPSQELGHSLIPSDSPRSASGLLQDITDQDINHLNQGNQSMCLSGQRVWSHSIPADLVNFSGQDNDTPNYQEEILAQDGDYEDVMAIDRSTDDEYGNDKQMLFPRKKKGVFPPVTPHACVKDNIGASSFDFVWSEIISWVQPVLRQYKEQTDQDDDVEEEVDIVDRENSLSPLNLNKEMALSRTPTMERPLSHEASQRSSRHDRQSRLSAKPSRTQENLGGVLTISSKPVLNRDKPVPLDSVEQLNVNFPIGRPNSRIRPLSTSNQMRINSARGGRIPRTNRLAPLRDERVKTPSIDDDRQNGMLGEVLRGKGYSQVNDSVSPPPMSQARPLPPINVDSIEFSSPPKRRNHQRIRSAIAEETRVPYQDPGSHLSMRPSTTQTFRVSNQSDIVGGGAPGSRRSSTSVGFNKNNSAAGFPTVTQSTSPRSGMEYATIQDGRPHSVTSFSYQAGGRYRPLQSAFAAQAPSSANQSASPASSRMLNLNVTGSGMMKSDQSEDIVQYDDTIGTHWGHSSMGTGLRRPKQSPHMTVSSR